MNKELFDQASSDYKNKNYQDALMGFTGCIEDENSSLAAGEMGLLYHRIGNCLVKLKNPTEAIQAYTQALSDDDYIDQGTVECNLGMAYASLHDFDNALSHFKSAVTDESYNSPYKAYIGMGNALLKLGKNAEAGVAFREAALDEANPDPTKALLNLGVCFMALDRPADAVASYESALQFNTNPDMANKLYASLGQAFVACGQMQSAVDAFEYALADKAYVLSDSASVDYQRAVAALAQGNADATQVLDLADMSGLDVAADGSTIYDDDEDQTDPFYYDEGYGDDLNNYPGYIGAYGEDNQDRFFNASEEELEQWSKGLAKQDRKRRNVGLKVLIVIIIVIVVLFVAAIICYTQGFGIPTQESVTEQLFNDPEKAKDEVFADSNEESRTALANIVVQDSNAVIEGIDRSMSDSTVYVSATTPEGSVVSYQLTMVRDFIGWKISNVELYNPSQN